MNFSINKFPIYNRKESESTGRFSFLINFGVMKYWNTGVMVKSWMSFYNTPILHVAGLNYMRQPWICLFIGYRSHKYCPSLEMK